ncbi:HDOD domain-containing protein [Marinobacter sp.]|uniref:HDOD domain-containing protein n=1 Tax=Marinobacter sp. TaxID=50741 RepID=UPI0034A58790
MDIAPDIQLPSLPEVTLRALEACHQDESYRLISDIVSTDAALVAQILALANSALYGPASQLRSVDQALLRLGTRRFHTLVLTAALRQLLFELGADQWQQVRDFWRHSLTTALTARALATLTRFPEPDQAFMLGMLHNVGELIALKTPPGDTRQHYFNHQCDIAAELVRAWGLGAMAEDAMRYQHAMPSEIRDAGHLVKLISLATRLAQSDAAGIAAAGTVFGLSEELTREIQRRIDREVAGVAVSLGIPLNTEYDASAANLKLKQTILKQAMAGQALTLSSFEGPLEDILAETVNSLTLITGLPALCFGQRDEGLTLLSGTLGDIPDLALSSSPAASVLTEAFTQRHLVHLGDRIPTVLDRQLLSLLQTPSLMAIPVLTANDCPGVFALGTDAHSAQVAEDLASLFCRELAARLSPSSTDSSDDGHLDAELARQALRRQVHEVSNPLTIIRQYIYQLRNRLTDAHVQNELDIIREELDRAGDMLLQISRPAESGQPPTDVSIAPLNAEIGALKDLFLDGLFSDANTVLNVQLCSEDTQVAASPSVIRQVLINLVRNAVESLGKAGEVTVRTSAPVLQNSRTWVELEISDSGHGIPDAIREQLFVPVKTTKGKGHSGLGLSIVKQLVDDMEGIIACRTGHEGTTFRLLLPAAGNKKNDND